MAKVKARRAVKSHPRTRNTRGQPTLRLGISVPCSLVSDLDTIADYLGVSRSYVISVLLSEPVKITAARIVEFGASASDHSEALTRAIVGTEENQMDLMLDDRLQLLKEAVSGRNL